MGMCKVNGPEALPLVPAGIEKLGHATKNICEAGFLYGDAQHDDYGQRVESKTQEHDHEMPNPDEVRFGQGTEADPALVHFVRHCERKSAHKFKSYGEAWRRQQEIKAARKARRKARKSK